jgi:hypothetical protein
VVPAVTVYVDDRDQVQKAILRREQDRERQRRYREKNREKVRAAERARYAADPKRAMSRHARWYQQNKDDPAVKAKALALGRKGYRTRADRLAVAVAGGPKPDACPICGRGGRICFDHSHATKRFRGWLCNSCNLILGHAKDDPELLRNLASYLENGRG